MGIEIDPSRLLDALLFVESVTKRACVDSLNRAGLHAIIGSGSGAGAMQLTPKADKAKIKAVDRKKVTGYVIKKLRVTGQWPVPREVLKKLVDNEYGRRVRAIGYAAFAAYSNAAKSYGGRGIKGVTEDFTKSEAARGYGKKATKDKLEAIFTNTAPAIEKIGGPALQKAVDNAAHDLEIYAQRKLEEIVRKV